jgi:hypoxanthine-DNA glycosylase
MNAVTSFKPVANEHARILILGSMPGVKSLDECQYYAHPHNSFWRIITTLLKQPEIRAYEERLQMLLDNNIALWDVLHQCIREGSLDSSIQNDSVITNDFKQLFKRCPNIKAVFFNGVRAEQDFHKHVLPGLDEQASTLTFYRMPSTSPAMASLRFEGKLEEWKRILEYL